MPEPAIPSETSTKTPSGTPATARVPITPSTQELIDRELAFGRDLRRRQPLVWWATLVGPFLATAAVLAALWATKGWEFVAKLAATAVVTFFSMGRFAILLGSDAPKADAAGLIEEVDAEHFSFLTSFQIFSLVTWMDLCVATLLIFHAAFLFRLPKLGPGMLRLREEGEFFMQYQPWIRRFSVVGLALFVAFPLAATGSIAGSIFGQLMGMTRRSILLAIVAGSILGNGAMFFFGGLIRRTGIFDPNNPLNLLGGVGIIIVAVAFLGWRYSKLKKRLARQGRFIRREG